MSATVYLAIPLMMVLAIVHAAVLARFPVLGVVPQISFLAALSWGLLHETEEGLIWAFIGGLFVDFLSIAPLGSSSLAWVISILLVLQLVQVFPTSRFVLPTLAAALGTLLYLTLYFLMLLIFDFAPSLETLAALLPLSILHAILILPVYWIMYTLKGRWLPRQVEI